MRKESGGEVSGVEGREGVIHLLHCVDMRTNIRGSFCKMGSTNAQMEQ